MEPEDIDPQEIADALNFETEEEEVVETEEVAEEVEDAAPSQEDIVNALYEKLKAEATANVPPPVEEEEELEPATTVEEVEQRAANRALRQINTMQAVHDEVDGIFDAMEKLAPVPPKVKNEVKTWLRNANPAVYRRGLGEEAALYAIGKAFVAGELTPKKTSKAPGGDAKVLSSSSKSVSPADQSAMSAFKNSPLGKHLSEKEIQEIFKN